MSGVAVLRIEFVFSEKIRKTVEEARRNGEISTLEELLEKLVEIFSIQLKQTPSFIKPLRELDPNLKIMVSSSVIGEKK